MNKKLGKVAAIALSAAMISSAFAMSTASSFAATTKFVPSLTVTSTPDVAAVAPANNAANDTTVAAATFLANQKSTLKTTVGAESGSSDVTFTAIKTASSGNVTYTSSNAAVVAVSGSDLVLKKGASGTVTVKATVKGVKFNNASGVDTAHVFETEHEASAAPQKDAATSDITLSYTVHVYQSGAAFIVNAAAAPTDVGTYINDVVKLPYNHLGSFTEVTAAADTNGLAAYTALDSTTRGTASYTLTGTQKDSFSATLAAETVADLAVKNPTTTANAGKSVTLVSPDKKASLTIATQRTYQVQNTTATITHASGYGTLADPQIADGATTSDVKDMTIDVNGKALTVNDATVGNIIDSASGSVTVNKGTVGDVTIGGNFDATSTNGNVTAGNVAAGGTVNAVATNGAVKTGTVKASNKVTVTGDDEKNADGSFSTLTVGNITANNASVATAGDAVDITATQNDDKSARGTVAVGNITTQGDVQVAAPQDASNLTVGTITGTVGQTENCPFLGSFTLKSGTFKTGDLKYIGAVTVTAGKLTTGAIDTGVLKTNQADCDTFADAPATGVTITAGELTASSIKTQKLAGNGGTLSLPAGSLEVAAQTDANANATGTILQITNLQSGSVLYKTVENKSSLFKEVVGVDTINATTGADGKTTYTAATVKFAGIKLDKDTLDIGKDDTAKLSVVSKSGSALPTGVTVKWQADKDTVQLTPSADGLSCDVKSIGYTDGNVNSGNNVTVSATLQKDGVDYTSVESYTADTAVTLTAEAPAVLTTKVNGQAVAADTVVKVTQSTAVPVSFSSNKTMADFKYSTGNAKVAETGTKTAWNGTAGEYTVYTNGAVGSQAGVFVNGKKVFIVEITGRPFKCDTTYDISMKAGKKYSFKITPAKDAPITDFTFNTANDSALSTWGFTKNADGTVTATLKANEVGKYGVFVNINGQQYKVFAVSVAK